MLKRFIALFALSGLTGTALAANEQPVLLELFTSQGCYSCPPAEKLLGSIVKRRGEQIVALEFHVDYWNDLIWGASGKWEDVHSSPEYTKRQRRYASAGLVGRRGVYTPQMVVGGQYAAVGSDRNTIEQQIVKLRRERAPLTVATRLEDTGLRVTIKGDAPNGTPVWLASYLHRSTTEITGGENDGKTLDNYNVVTELRRIGEWRNGGFEVVVPNVKVDHAQSCAVFVQRESLGQVFGTGHCPSI